MTDTHPLGQPENSPSATPDSSPQPGRLSRRSFVTGTAATTGFSAFGMGGANAAASQAGGTSPITLAAIHVWHDGQGNGERKITDTAKGGVIQSATGGTLPAFPITVDPTPYVHGAAGSKEDWLVQFRMRSRQGSGTWTRLVNGDLQFTPGIHAGAFDNLYRVSDDGGSTWSHWERLTTLVLDRGLCPGPYFLVEDYSGTDKEKVEAARDAAGAAGGGTVTTLQRSTVRMLVNIAMEPKVHFLFPNFKKPDAIHAPTGEGCSPTGNGECENWSPGFFSKILDSLENRQAISDSDTRIWVLGGKLDGNSFKQALHHTAGAAPIPNSNCGTCWPGDRSGRDTFNLQQSHTMRLEGALSPDVADQAKFGVMGVEFVDGVADAIHTSGTVDVIAEDNVIESYFRGGINVLRGNSTLVAKRNAYLTGPNNIGAGIDHELGGRAGGSAVASILHEDEYIDNDFDAPIRSNSVYKFNGCTIGPGLLMIARNASGALFSVGPSGTSARGGDNARGTIRFHTPGGGTGSRRPFSAVLGWENAAPHDATFRFQEQDFLAWGAPYAFHATMRIPAAGQTWEIQLGETVDTAAIFRVEVINCTARKASNFPTGEGSTVRLFRTVKELTTTQVVHIDGLSIGTGFEQAAVQLNGQRLEYRNVAHEDFPGATIQQICPGAGEYVQI